MAGADSKILRAERRNLPVNFASLDRPVIAVSAPAGYGKSTLLAEWRRDVLALGFQFVSLVVDADDRDGDRLLLDLLNAFAPADAKRSQMLLGGVGDRGRRAIIMALLAELSAREQRTVLFIDDIHWLDDSAAESILRLLVGHLPERLALVLSGRSNLTGPASEALLEGRMRRYGTAQLALDSANIGDLLRQHHVQPRPVLVRNILERTQGWPAVVRLIAMTLQEDEGHQDSLLQSLLERRQALSEYLSNVLLSRLPSRTAQFLLGIALLRRFSAELAAVTTEMADAAALIEDLERRALPLSASGDASLPYALHPLVREFLLVRLRHDDPALLRRFTANALEWLTAQQRNDAAIDLSLDAGDVDAAAALIDGFARSAARHYGRHATFLYWCNKIPREQLSNYPQIQVVRVWTLNAMRRYAEADEVLAEVEATVSDPTRTHDPQVIERLELEQCIRLVLRDQWINLAPRVHAWLQRWPQSDALHRGMAFTMIGCDQIAGSDFENAIENLSTGHRLLSECRAYYVATWVSMWKAAALAKQGNYRQALFTCDEAVAVVASHLGGQTPAEIMMHAQRGLLLYELDRLEEAGAALEYGLTAMIEQSSVDSLIMGTVALARLQNARHMHLDALDTLAEGEVLGWSQDLPRLAIALAAERIDLLLRQGEAAQASELWQVLQQTVKRRTSAACDLALHDKTRRIEARLALVRGDWADASERVAPALENATRTGQKRKQVELLLMQALASHGAKNVEHAFALLKRALEVAMPQGFVRVFADEGASMHALLEAYVDSRRGSAARTAMHEYLGLLVDAAQHEQTRDSAAPVQDALSALTRREIKILGKLQSSLSNRELAGALFITEGTLKWHLKNIYSKLGVASRVAAIASGRERGLLD